MRWQTSNCSSLLIYRPREDERLSLPGWLTYSGRFTHISGLPSAQVERRTAKERWPETDRRTTAEPRGPTCRYAKTAGAPPGPRRGAYGAPQIPWLYLNIAWLTTGSWKNTSAVLGSPAKVPDFFVSTRVGTLLDL